MATNNTPRPVADHLRQAANGIPNTARGRLMLQAAEDLDRRDLVIEERDRTIAELEADRPPEGWVAIDPSSGPAVFYLGLDGTLYRYDENDPRPIPGMVDRAVARTLLRIASESLEEADRG